MTVPYQSIGLTYRPTLRDCEEIVSARRSGSKQVRRAKLVLPLVGLAAILLGAADGGSAGALFGATVGAALAVFVVRPRRERRSLHERAVRRGGHLATVDEDGVYVEHELGSERIAWAGLDRYIETDNLFVLLEDDDEDTTCPAALPKEYLSDAETDRLRELLDTRLGRD